MIKEYAVGGGGRKEPWGTPTPILRLKLQFQCSHPIPSFLHLFIIIFKLIRLNFPDASFSLATLISVIDVDVDIIHRFVCFTFILKNYFLDFSFWRFYSASIHSWGEALAKCTINRYINIRFELNWQYYEKPDYHPSYS